MQFALFLHLVIGSSFESFVVKLINKRISTDQSSQYAKFSLVQKFVIRFMWLSTTLRPSGVLRHNILKAGGRTNRAVDATPHASLSIASRYSPARRSVTAHSRLRTLGHHNALNAPTASMIAIAIRRERARFIGISLTNPLL